MRRRGTCGGGDTAIPRQPLRVCHKPKRRAFLIASQRAGPCGNFRAASKASSACASKSEASVCSAFILLRRREQRTFGPHGARRFHPANRSRNSFHRVAPATLDTRFSNPLMPGSIRCRSMRCRHVGQEGRLVGNSWGNPLARMDALRQCPNVNQKRCRRLYGCRQAISESQFRTRVEPRMSVMWSGTDSQLVHRNFSV